MPEVIFDGRNYEYRNFKFWVAPEMSAYRPHTGYWGAEVYNPPDAPIAVAWAASKEDAINEIKRQIDKLLDKTQ